MRVAISLPFVLATAFVLALVVGERTGARPFAAPPFRNSAEAAAAGDAAAMLRMMRLGDNPTWLHHVRPDLISSQIVTVTTPEAALWSRQMNLIRVLDREGALGGDRQRHELACLARDLQLAAVADYLAPGVACVPDQAMQRVVQRSAGPNAGGGDE